jgi:hypothetical protein
MQEGSGNRTGDHASKVLVDFNTVGTDTGKVEATAASFVEGNSEKLEIAAAHGLQGQRDFSITLWYKRGSSLVNGGVVTCQAGSTNALSDYYLYSSGTSLNWVVPQGATTRLIAFPTVTLGDWHFYHVYYDAAADLVGGSMDNGARATVANIGPNLQGGAFTVGRLNSQNYITGSAEQLNFYSRVLTEAEETELWNAGAGMAYPG